ncbi:MAG TPA: lipid carrier--UDP-N-acetylgalactosaminyltransferase [Deltaproteobacteria bacterium]|nr:lipid carrier--UDP-N-acetylgalactosaminyltransferase [Deltaproteobacteria bacterium]
MEGSDTGNAACRDTVNTRRIFDILVSLVLLALMCIPMLVIAIVIKLSSRGPVFYWSDRVGINNSLFKMPKFRTMRVGAPEVATHLMKNPEQYLTPIGSILRKLSLDELPQLWSVLKGDMSLVGPRPALYNQDDLIEMRTRMGIHKLLPGLTGWAQVNGRDDLPIPIKVEYDAYYMKNRNLRLDLKILWLTIVNVLKKEGVRY